jgi:hypothetical protein
MPFHREETNDGHERLILARWVPRLPELRHEVRYFSTTETFQRRHCLENFSCLPVVSHLSDV